MPAKRKLAPRQDNTLARREATMEAFTALVLTVPEAEAGDIADLLGPILAALDWEELNNVSTLPSSKTLTGRQLRVDSIARKPGDKPSATGFYLLCEGFDISTGEELRFTAGGGHAVAVLSKLHALRALPAYVQFDVAVTTTNQEAINCTVLGRDPSKIIDAE